MYVSYKDGEHIYIGDNIKTISGYIPSHKSSSSSLSSLGAHVIFHVNQMTPPKVSYVGAQWASGSIVYVPKGAKALWESHENWKNGWCNIAYANSAPTIIEENTIEKVLLDKHELIIDVGESAMLLATPIPVDADDVSMMWFSKDETIATVSQTGNVKALSPGSTWIYAVSKVNDNVKDSCRITSIKHVTSIHVNEPNLFFNTIGTSKLVEYYILPKDASDKTVKWSSSNEAVCSVTEKGEVFATGDGTAVVIAQTVDGGYTATCIVTVDTKIHVDKITMTPSSLTLTKIGDTAKLDVKIEPQNATDTNVTWKSSNDNVCLVTSDGTVVATGNGISIVDASAVDNGKTASCIVTVNVDTGIEEVGTSIKSTFDIYSINGSKMRSKATSTADLPRGVYVIDGKKIIK